MRSDVRNSQKILPGEEDFQVMKTSPFQTQCWCANNVPTLYRSCMFARAFHQPYQSVESAKKIVYTSRFVRVILAQGPC